MLEELKLEVNKNPVSAGDKIQLIEDVVWNGTSVLKAGQIYKCLSVDGLVGVFEHIESPYIYGNAKAALNGISCVQYVKPMVGSTVYIFPSAAVGGPRLGVYAGDNSVVYLTETGTSKTVLTEASDYMRVPLWNTTVLNQYGVEVHKKLKALKDSWAIHTYNSDEMDSAYNVFKSFKIIDVDLAKQDALNAAWKGDDLSSVEKMDCKTHAAYIYCLGVGDELKADTILEKFIAGKPYNHGLSNSALDTWSHGWAKSKAAIEYHLSKLPADSQEAYSFLMAQGNKELAREVLKGKSLVSLGLEISVLKDKYGVQVSQPLSFDSHVAPSLGELDAGKINTNSFATGGYKFADTYKDNIFDNFKDSFSIDSDLAYKDAWVLSNGGKNIKAPHGPKVYHSNGVKPEDFSTSGISDGDIWNDKGSGAQYVHKDGEWVATWAGNGNTVTGRFSSGMIQGGSIYSSSGKGWGKSAEQKQVLDSMDIKSFGKVTGEVVEGIDVGKLSTAFHEMSGVVADAAKKLEAMTAAVDDAGVSGAEYVVGDVVKIVETPYYVCSMEGYRPGDMLVISKVLVGSEVEEQSYLEDEAVVYYAGPLDHDEEKWTRNGGYQIYKESDFKLFKKGKK